MDDSLLMIAIILIAYLIFKDLNNGGEQFYGKNTLYNNLRKIDRQIEKLECERHTYQKRLDYIDQHKFKIDNETYDRLNDDHDYVNDAYSGFFKTEPQMMSDDHGHQTSDEYVRYGYKKNT